MRVLMILAALSVAGVGVAGLLALKAGNYCLADSGTALVNKARCVDKCKAEGYGFLGTELSDGKLCSSSEFKCVCDTGN